MKKSKSTTTRRAISPALYSSTKMDWETPQDLFDRLNTEFRFTIDVAASPENAKCARFYTEKDNGLERSWKNEICWMNPPYGFEIGLWMAKAYLESRDGATVVCLVPSRTDTAWWHNYAMKGEIRFLKGRLKFGGSNNSAPFPSAIIVFYANVKKYTKIINGRPFMSTMFSTSKKGGAR